MKTGFPVLVVPGFLALVVVAWPVQADNLDAHPDGYGEVPTLSSPAKADFDAKINREETEISYELSYSGFPTAVQQAHIHLGRRAVNGGVMVFLCSNLGNGPAGTPACPTPEGKVTGVLTAASVVGPAAQGVAPGEFAEVLNAIREGAAYVNIHTVAFPSGEIRDQVKSSRRHHH